jgi:hypothetical protein
VAPAAAQVATVPKVTGKLVIAGTPQVGETLAASATWTGDPAPTATWVWYRCDRTAGGCTKIAGATTDRYVVAAADVGMQLRVGLRVSNTAGSDEARSEPTAAVQAAPQPSPTPTPTPTPEPAATPSHSPPPNAAATQFSLLEPFPVVRLRGSLTLTGARINVFTVRVPAHVLVSVRCRGSSCPSSRLARRVSAPRTIRLSRFERQLRAGTRLTVKVTRRGRIGKWSTFVIRRGAAPRRSDLCAYPHAGAPAPCPT